MVCKGLNGGLCPRILERDSLLGSVDCDSLAKDTDPSMHLRANAGTYEVQYAE